MAIRLFDLDVLLAPDLEGHTKRIRKIFCAMLLHPNTPEDLRILARRGLRETAGPRCVRCQAIIRDYFVMEITDGGREVMVCVLCKQTNRRYVQEKEGN